MKAIHTFLLPDLITEKISGSIAVVIDVLRASTTIVHAMQNGAQSVRPCSTVDEATAAKNGESDLLLGGERGCRIIEGFDLDNSPSSYNSELVRGRALAFTTTNGTRAMLKSQKASRILIGAFANLSAVAGACRQAKAVSLVCAGTNGDVTSEDCLFAGHLVHELLSQDECEIDDSSELVLNHFAQVGDDDDEILQALMASQGGRNLLANSMQSDVELCAQRSTHSIVPEFDPSTGLIGTIPFT